VSERLKPAASKAPHGATNRDRGEDWAWQVVLAAAGETTRRSHLADPVAYAWDDEGLRPVSRDHPEAVLGWFPGRGWVLLLEPSHPQHALIDLYLPVCNATQSAPITVGHLGQSLDGFIATHSGDSQYVTGPENLRHMHRMRALSDAIIVGAGTVAADDPQLTTRHVPGPSPLRVIFDPTRRLDDRYRVFSDPTAESIYVCAKSLWPPGQSHLGLAKVIPLDDLAGVVDASQVLTLVRGLGCHRVFVEGGGVTVSLFLEAGLLDHLQVAIAPLIIGDGRPAIRLQEPPAALGDCHRPRYRVFRMGGDVLFDCQLRETAPDGDGHGRPPLQRIY
jgi:diaminohydroxyphosphoribosylaminopyrimidine deaminase / 5-amino-6-(5-phosphoribosylamino)uracil reductase